MGFCVSAANGASFDLVNVAATHTFEDETLRPSQAVDSISWVRRYTLRLVAPDAQECSGESAVHCRCQKVTLRRFLLYLSEQASNQPISKSTLRESDRLRDGKVTTDISMIKEDAERWRIEFLLPWYAAGTLSRSEADCVEKALADDLELARRYALVLKELAETISLNEALGEPSASVAETLFAAIDAEEARTPRRRRLHRSAPNAALSASLAKRA